MWQNLNILKIHELTVNSENFTETFLISIIFQNSSKVILVYISHTPIHYFKSKKISYYKFN